MANRRPRHGPIPEPAIVRARQLRREPSEAERKLWYLLRSRRFGAAKFRRQFPIGPFIADFCCFERRLVLELDGGQHASQPEEDRCRSAFLRANGYKVIRFWNDEVLRDTESVLTRILAALGQASVF